MRIVKSSLKVDKKDKFERILETSTNIYYFCFGGINRYAQKYNRKMKLISESIDIDNEISEIYKNKDYIWVNKKFEKTFGNMI